MNKALLLVLMLTIFICQGAESVDQPTTDTAGDIGQDVSQHVIEDARLDQKVTYEARHKPVKEILADISSMTGVTLHAGYNSKDWQVRDRKMNIFAKDIPLLSLMNSIARVMKFKWSSNHNITPWTYRIYMDRKVLLGADAELYRAQRAYDKEVIRLRESFADTIKNWDDNLSSGELEQLRHDNPCLYLLHTRGGGAAVRGLFQDVPGLEELFVNQARSKVAIPISSLSPETQDQVLNAAKLKYELKPWGGNGEPFPSNSVDAFSQGYVSFTITRPEYSSALEQHRNFGSIRLHINDRDFSVHVLREPSSPVNQWAADAELQAYEKNMSLEDIWRQEIDTPSRRQANDEEDKRLKNILPEQPTVEHPDEPALHNKIKLSLDKTKNIELVDIESALAEASGFAVVSDSFRYLLGSAAISESETELKDVLVSIGDGYRYSWAKRGDIIELWSTEWFKKRMNQLPDEWVDVWLTKFKKLGYLCIDDYAQIQSLSLAQIEESIWGHQEFLCIDLGDERSLMRLYASLNTAQRKAMFSEIGLPLTALGPNQWELLCRVFNNPSVESGEIPTLLWCSVATMANQPPIYTFEVINSETGDGLAQWVITLPRYVEPPKPKAAPLIEPTETGRRSSDSDAETEEGAISSIK